MSRNMILKLWFTVSRKTFANSKGRCFDARRFNRFINFHFIVIGCNSGIIVPICGRYMEIYVFTNFHYPVIFYYRNFTTWVCYGRIIYMVSVYSIGGANFRLQCNEGNNYFEFDTLGNSLRLYHYYDGATPTLISSVGSGANLELQIARATKDSDGNVIKDTYAKKSELGSGGTVSGAYLYQKLL